MLNVKAIIQNDESLCGHCSVQITEESKRGIRKWEEKWFKTRTEDGERGGGSSDNGRLFHRWAAATGNALSPTVDRRVRGTSRDVDETGLGLSVPTLRRFCRLRFTIWYGTILIAKWRIHILNSSRRTKSSSL